MQSNETTKPDGEKPKKTYKRELAFLLFVWLVYLVETKEPELVKILAFPIFTYIALAMGMSWYSPNGSLLRGQSYRTSDWRGPERSSQRPGWEDQYSDSRDYNRYRAEASTAQGEGHPADSRHEQGQSRIG